MVNTSSTTGLSFERYLAIRQLSETLCETLSTEDFVIQSMPDASPVRWHLAHTTWFFETFVLRKAIADYEPFEPAFAYLFNSYYNSVGKQFSRNRRGLLSRPTVAEIYDYRKIVDEQIQELLTGTRSESLAELLPIVEIGLHHEQQHQELILTDIKHAFSCNPIYPVYREVPVQRPKPAPTLGWIGRDEGVYWVGSPGEKFAFDNELPRHRQFLESNRLASRLVTNGEYAAFIDDQGYQRPELWLSEGWKTVCDESWNAPLYWVRRDGGWWQFTLSGLWPLKPNEPVCHVSYYEADAYARWADARLPTEAEWEVAADDVAMEGNFVEQATYHPRPVVSEAPENVVLQIFGDVWEWTSSPYTAYPGYTPNAGALGEYNGKFMSNQMVLRGGSCVTSRDHIRKTYRNFFPPDARWQFSGIRLAR